MLGGLRVSIRVYLHGRRIVLLQSRSRRVAPPSHRGICARQSLTTKQPVASRSSRYGMRVEDGLWSRYRFECLLREGAVASVCLARDVRLDRMVAIKFLRHESATSRHLARFLAEIRTAARLQHPHILSLIDAGDCNGLPYYVMPYVPGKALRDRLESEKQLPLCDALRITVQVASALDYAHRQGVVHRDIKPDNILLHDGSALIADLGIALTRSPPSQDRVTDPEFYLGTPQYMSPEQALGERTIDGRSDIFSLGCVLYEMLTGAPPFAGAAGPYAIAKSVTEAPVAPRVVRETISRSIEDVVLKALAKIPADRFQTAAEFSSALAASA